MKKIKTALISVSNKKKLAMILPVLKKFKIEIISSGGTFKSIKKLGFKSTELSEYTNFPEILDGRVKTLHPKIHAGILSKRNKTSHKKQLKSYNFKEIDLVIVNFYPFEEIMKGSKNKSNIIENIDIGGPSMVRGAAKNYENVTVITSIDQYEDLKNELSKNLGSTSLNFRQKMSQKAFIETGYYDSVIANYFLKITKKNFPSKKLIYANKIDDLRYGENPHQVAAVYSTVSPDQRILQLHGKKLSYNNYNDLYSALEISKSLPKNIGCVIVKHANPCGVSINKNNLKSFKMALKCDPISAFGGIVSCNFRIKEKLAHELSKIFFEIIIGNSFSKEALNILKRKKNLRIIDSSKVEVSKLQNIKTSFNNILIQTNDNKSFSSKDFSVVSKSKPNKNTMNNLIFAFNVCRFVKSNAIVITKDFSTVGIGSGQPSRIDSCKIAIKKMQNFQKIKNNEKIFAASDAFFPFVDGIEKLVASGVSAVIQPSGSIRDKDIIKFADKLGIILVFSKTRHFKH